jgi:hypothetical protein
VIPAWCLALKEERRSVSARPEGQRLFSSRMHEPKVHARFYRAEIRVISEHIPEILSPTGESSFT